MRPRHALRFAGLAVLAFGAALAQGPALAQPAAVATTCASENSGLPSTLAAWTSPAAPVSATSPANLHEAQLTPGAAARLTLHPIREITFGTSPAKPSDPGSQGGLVATSISRPGTYRIALSKAAWIDVVKDGQFQTSIAHGHGPACTTIRKLVDFALAPGDYVIQISDADAASVDMLVTAAP